MKLMLIDGNSIINRAFYGIRLLTNSEGLYTNAVYGFLTIMQKLLDEHKPEALCVAFDLKAPTFRHEQYEGYKAQRKGMPEELAVQMPVMKNVLDAMNIMRCELEGWEADDLLGTMSRRAEENGWDCLVVTGDRDSFQLITEHTHILHVHTKLGQTETTEYTPALFREEYGFEPVGIIELKALMGDSSDNIPGVSGIGEKTALELVRGYVDVPTLYAKIESGEAKLKPAALRRLTEGWDMAFMSRELATIRTDAPISFEPNDALRKDIDRAALLKIFRELDFTRLIERYGLDKEENTEAETYSGECVSETVGSAERAAEVQKLLEKQEYVSVLCTPDLDLTVVMTEDCAYVYNSAELGKNYRDALVGIFSKRVNKVGHNVKELMRRLLDEGIEADGFVFDTMLAAYLLSPTDSDFTLEKLALKYNRVTLPDEKNYTVPGAFSPLADCTAAYAAFLSHAAAIDMLRETMKPKLRELGLDRLLHEVELPLCAVLASMEHEGFMTDRAALKAFSESLSAAIDVLQASIYGYAGETFNINSTKQLGAVLFDKLMLPHAKKTKTGYSTNIDVLEKLRGKHPIIEKIINYRQLTKLQSTYCDGLMKVIAQDGRIHTNFKMTATATGRLSSAEPNLQNIPVRTELGGEMRKMFVAEEEKVLVDADYSQIELRLLAHISGDETMRDAFLSREDIHTATAAQVFGVSVDEVTPRMRSSAKAVNFGIVYGISDFSLAQDIGVTKTEAGRYIESYLENYNGVREYMSRIVEQAKKQGYVTTLMGRRREIPELASENHNTRAFGERVALNTPIQGTAADIIKMAMVHVYERLKAENLEAKLIMQVHDELIVEAPVAEAERVARILTEEMQNVVSLSVPLTVEAKWGKTWYEAK